MTHPLYFIRNKYRQHKFKYFIATATRLLNPVNPIPDIPFTCYVIIFTHSTLWLRITMCLLTTTQCEASNVFYYHFCYLPCHLLLCLSKMHCISILNITIPIINVSVCGTKHHLLTLSRTWKSQQFSYNIRLNHIFWTTKNYYKVHICCHTSSTMCIKQYNFTCCQVRVYNLVSYARERTRTGLLQEERWGEAIGWWRKVLEEFISYTLHQLLLQC